LKGAMSMKHSTMYAILFSTLSILLSSMVFIPGGIDVDGLTVSGNVLSEDTVWTTGDSPVNVEDNLTVPPGITLTIREGVTVNIGDGKWLNVRGTLIAVGTDQAPVNFTSDGEFDRVNITNGGSALFDHVMVNNTSIGVEAASAGTVARVYNSTFDTDTPALSSISGAEVWAVNCTFISMINVSVSGGTLHEGNWFRLTAMKDNGEGPYEGADLEIFATQPQGSTWTVYDSVSGDDPSTGPDGRTPPVAVEQFLHEGYSSTSRVMVQIKMTAPSRSKQLYPVYMGADFDYTWWMDFTPPRAPANLTVLDKGGTWIKIGWDYPGDPMEVKFFVISHKKHWESDWDTEEPGPSARDWNISTEQPPNEGGGLVEEMEYDIMIRTIDGANNPSPDVGPISVKTLDITPPLPPTDVVIEDVGGHHATLRWNHSASDDVTGYEIFLNNSGGQPSLHSLVEPSETNIQAFNITPLASETDYEIWIRSVDDGEIPRTSAMVGPVSFRTLDITPPDPPILSLTLIDPMQFLNGSGLYNSSQVGLSGSVPGEDRCFIDVFLDGIQYVNPNPDAPRPAAMEGRFFFFITMKEGVHSIRVRAVDPAGNAGPLSNQVNITIDLTPPVMEVNPPNSGTLYVDSDLEMSLEANPADENGIHSVIWRVEGPNENWEYQGDVLVNLFGVGSYIVTVEVADRAGNMNMTSFQVISRLPDRDPPRAWVVSPETNVDLDHAPEFDVRFSEPVMFDMIKAVVVPSDTGAGAIEMLYSFDEKNLTANFLLTSSLEGGSNYTFLMGPVVDLRGNRGENLTFEFRTIDDDRLDSDGDGIPDYYEVLRTFLSPSDPSDASLDSDNDGVSNLDEYIHGTDPGNADTDGDEMTDGWELDHGLSPLDRSDALQDPDRDSYTNLEEFRAGTDPMDSLDHPSSGKSSAPSTLLLLIIVIIAVIAIIGAVLFIVIMGRRRRMASGMEEEGTVPVTGELEEEEEIPEERECPSCGAVLVDGLDYCPECGLSIHPSGDEGGIEPSIPEGEEESIVEDEGSLEDSLPLEGIPENGESDISPPGNEMEDGGSVDMAPVPDLEDLP